MKARGGTTSSFAPLLFLIIAIIRIPSGGSVVERGLGNERRSFGCLWFFCVNSLVVQCVPQFLLRIFANDAYSFLSVSNKWIHEYGQEFRRRCGKTPEEE